jgi:hypothetical protein
MEREILIFDKGEKICSVMDCESHPQDTLMCLLSIDYEGEKLDVLQILDMDYAIVIPRHVALRLDGVLEEHKEGKE